MNDPEYDCPLCKADLRAERIPDDIRHHYGADYFSRAILVEVRGVYDGGLFYHCPDCGGDYHRWPEGSRLRAVAERHMRIAPELREAG